MTNALLFYNISHTSQAELKFKTIAERKKKQNSKLPSIGILCAWLLLEENDDFRLKYKIWTI